MRRTTDVLRAVLASAAIAMLVIGLPALLVTSVGWPLPRQLPHLSDIGDTLTGHQPLETTTVWKILAAILWLAWLQIVVAVVVEVVSVARGAVPRPLRGLNLAQGMVAPLVATIVLAWPAGAVTRASAAPAPTAPARDAPVTAVIEPPVTALAHTEPTAAPPAPPAVIEHTVQRRDTLWDLAEHYLGDGHRATELFELNRGRPQPDGGSLTDPGLLRPGWTLHIPIPPPAGPAEADVTVSPGDSLWDLAEDHLGDGHRFSEIFDLNAGHTQPDGETLTDPSLLRPGWRIQLPETAQVTPAPNAAVPETPPNLSESSPPPPAVASVPEEAAAPAPPQTQASDEAHPAATPVDGSEDGDTNNVAGRLGVAGGFLGAGLAAAVAVRRRRQRTQRAPGTELPSLGDPGDELSEALADADIDTAERATIALRHLGAALAERPTVPVPIVCSLDGDHVELLLDRNDPNAPTPWTALADGRVWRRRLDDSAADGPSWLPTLVSLGAADAGGVLLNLEAAGIVAVTGDRDGARALVRSFAAELAVTPLADLPALHLVGPSLGDLSGIPNMEHHPDVDSALEAARRDAAALAAALDATGAAAAAELRCHSQEEAWPPAIVVADAADIRDRLASVTGSRGVVTVAVGHLDDVFELHVGTGVISVPALGLVCPTQQLDEHVVQVVTDVLHAAEMPCAAPAPEQPRLFQDDDQPPTDEVAEDEHRLRVRLLGALTTTGADLRPQQLAIVAYLALHGAVTADALRHAIWAGRPPTRERFLNTIHELRKVVGIDVLPASTDGRYRLHHTWCDATELERLLSVPDDSTRADRLRAALELVTGPPLSFDSRHRRQFSWVDSGNLPSRFERLIGDAAHDLASIALDDGDANLARWAAEQGLLASPGSEILTADLVSSHLAAGDQRTAERVVDEFARALEDLGYDETPESLLELLEHRSAS